MWDSANAPIIAVDGGTTNTRARLVTGGRVTATARRAVGVRDTVFTDGATPLVVAVREAINEVRAAAGHDRPELIVAAGMLTSEVGLRAVPHVAAPAGIEELAGGSHLVRLPEIADVPVLLVPGVRTPAGVGPDGWFDADVMRGEECETIGALLGQVLLSSPRGRVAFLWPGSHTKLVGVDVEGPMRWRIRRSHTTLAGEMLEALARHSLLAASLPPSWPDALDESALLAGKRACEREGLGRAAFLVRIASLTGSLDPRARASFFLGALLGDDVAHLARHPVLADAIPVWVGGRQPQRSLYASWLAECHSGPVELLDDDLCESASAIGAFAVASQRDRMT